SRRPDRARARRAPHARARDRARARRHHSGRRAPTLPRAQPARQATRIAGWQDGRIAGREGRRSAESRVRRRRPEPARMSSLLQSCTSMVRYHASWVLPIDQPPIRDGWVTVDRGRIVALGRRTPAAGRAAEVDLGEVCLLPGLVNAHTHLELSSLRDRAAPVSECVAWIRALIAARREHADPRAPAIVDAVDPAIAEAIASGTALVGDISNTLITLEPLKRSALAAVVFYE